MPHDSPRKAVYTITGRNFMDALAQGLIRRYGGDPSELAKVRVLLPNRRACRALADAFLRVSPDAASVLPTTTPIGDVDEEYLSIPDSELPDVPEQEAAPPSIAPLERSLLLSTLVMKANPSLGPAHAIHLSTSLSRLLDEVQTERFDFADLSKIVPDQFAEHWQETLGFIKIVTEYWPDILSEIGCIDPAERRNQLLAALTASWEKLSPPGPVIAAGTTGSIPATADLLACIAELDQGAVVLPGLDRTLDPDSREALEASHPQFGMMRLLGQLGIEPAKVADWEPAIQSGRLDLVNSALRPPRTATRAVLSDDVENLLSGVSRIHCSVPQQEAQIIALILREALETPGRTASLITPDRRLARMVAAELRRWKVEIDDSGGVPLNHTVPGVFLSLTAEAIAEDAAPFPLLAALKHPLAAGGLHPAEFRREVRRLERFVLRGRRPEPGLEGLVGDVERLCSGNDKLIALIRHLQSAAQPFSDLLRSQAVHVDDLVQAHVAFAESLAATDGETGSERLWTMTAGRTAAAFVGELRRFGDRLEPIPGSEWPAVLDALLTGWVVRTPYGLHPRLHIWGLQEARLQRTDVVVLGSLNEGAWPPRVADDPWMSRPMRADLDLPPPERRLGLTAHDFVQGFSASQVYLTRSTRVDGSPTVPARWLSRIETLLSTEETGRRILERWQGEQSRLVRWQEQQDGDERKLRALRTAPPMAPHACPPVHARPSRLSVTAIETLIRDPYAIYARHVLDLSALDPIDPDPGPADLGTLVHEAIDRFVSSLEAMPSDDTLARFIEVGQEVFAPHLGRPEVRAFWWPRFLRIANWIAKTERSRRNSLVRSFTEINGKLTIPRGDSDFTLTAKADRIDIMFNGKIAVIDYKTGSLPSKADVVAFLSPQLPLQAAMVKAGAFADIPPSDVAELTYWHLSGSDETGMIRPAADIDPNLMAEAALDSLKDLLSYYEFPEVPYRACPDPNIMPRYSDYAHLERIHEWADTGHES